MLATFLLLYLATFSTAVEALRCFSCDNGAWGDQCIDNPASIPNPSVPCKPPYDEFCYTRRLEEDGSKLNIRQGRVRGDLGEV